MLLGIALLALAGCSQSNLQPLQEPPRPVVDQDGPELQPPPDEPNRGDIGNFGLQRADWEGVWHDRQPDVFGYSEVQTVLMINGTFSSQSRNAEASTLVTITGQWDLFTFTDGPMLRFAVEDFEPKEWCGPMGCVAIQIPTGQSHYFRFVSRNTVILREPGCDSAACEVTYRRR